MEIYSMKTKDLKECPCCGNKLKKIKKFGKNNLAKEIVLHCKVCYSDFQR